MSGPRPTRDPASSRPMSSCRPHPRPGIPIARGGLMRTSRPQTRSWLGDEGLDPLPPRCNAVALPTELHPHDRAVRADVLRRPDGSDVARALAAHRPPGSPRKLSFGLLTGLVAALAWDVDIGRPRRAPGSSLAFTAAARPSARSSLAFSSRAASPFQPSAVDPRLGGGRCRRRRGVWLTSRASVSGRRDRQWCGRGVRRPDRPPRGSSSETLYRARRSAPSATVGVVMTACVDADGDDPPAGPRVVSGRRARPLLGDDRRLAERSRPRVAPGDHPVTAITRF